MTYNQYVLHVALNIMQRNTTVLEDNTVDWTGTSDITMAGYQQGWDTEGDALLWCIKLACRRGNRRVIPYKDWLYYNKVLPGLKHSW